MFLSAINSILIFSVMAGLHYSWLGAGSEAISTGPASGLNMPLHTTLGLSRSLEWAVIVLLIMIAVVSLRILFTRRKLKQELDQLIDLEKKKL